METKLVELKSRLHEADDVRAANAILNWDQTTYMPEGGAAARARQLATLGRIGHEMFTDPAIGRLLDDLRPHEEGLPYDSDDASLIRVTRREYERATRVPSDFVASFPEASSRRSQARAPCQSRVRVRDEIPSASAAWAMLIPTKHRSLTISAARGSNASSF